jgi:hypothetical protein
MGLGLVINNNNNNVEFYVLSDIAFVHCAKLDCRHAQLTTLNEWPRVQRFSMLFILEVVEMSKRL